MVFFLFHFHSTRQEISSIFFFLVIGISDSDIAGVTLPTGVPILLELDSDLRPVKPRQLLGDQAKIQAAIKKVEDQGKAKLGGK